MSGNATQQWQIQTMQFTIQLADKRKCNTAADSDHAVYDATCRQAEIQHKKIPRHMAAAVQGIKQLRNLRSEAVLLLFLLF